MLAIVQAERNPNTIAGGELDESDRRIACKARTTGPIFRQSDRTGRVFGGSAASPRMGADRCKCNERSADSGSASAYLDRGRLMLFIHQNFREQRKWQSRQRRNFRTAFNAGGQTSASVFLLDVSINLQRIPLES